MSRSICVVGAGLAGGLLASRLTALGHNVTLVEQGDSQSPLVPADERWSGDSLKATFTRGQGLGGSSNFWHGGLIPLDRTDLDDPAPGATLPRSPLRYDDLRRHYESVLEVMSGGDVSPADLFMDESAADGIPVDATRFRLKPMYFSRDPFSTYAAIVKARDAGMRVITGVQVRRVALDSSGTVSGIVARRHSDGQEIRVEADATVLCAGGIGSPKILLNSRERGNALEGLPVGEHLIDHPTGFVFKAKLRRATDLRSWFGSAHGSARLHRRRLGIASRPDRLEIGHGRNHVLYLRPAFSLRDPAEYNELKSRLVGHRGERLSIADYVRLAMQADLLAEAANFKFGLVQRVRYVSGFTFAEQFVTSGNAITRTADGEFNIRWGMAQEDKDSLSHFIQSFLDHHTGLFEEVRVYPGQLGSGAHHSGGCRMAHRAPEGVVDATLRVFGTKNLYVADGSVLGYTGHANTGLTIGAVAHHCAAVLDGDSAGAAGWPESRGPV